MLIPLIAIYFFYFQCCYQLSKAKKLLGENVYIFIKFRAESVIFPLFKGVLNKNFTSERYLLSANSSVMINLIISKNKLAFTVTVLQKNVKTYENVSKSIKNKGNNQFKRLFL